MQAMQQATSETGAPRPSKRRFFQQSQIYLMLLPNLILFTTLAAFPILWSLRYMFFDYDGIHQAVFTGLDNFVRIFTRDPIYWQSLWVTLVYAFGKLSLVLPLAFLVAVVLNVSFRGSALLQAIIFSPTIMSASVMALIFYLLFNVYNGDVNHYLMALGLIDQPIEWLGPKFAMLTVVIVAVWGGLGNYMVYFLAGLQTIPKDVYEAADLEGAGYWQRLFKITLPMLGPVLRVILMLSIVTTFQDIQSIMVLTEGGPLGKTQVVFLYMYQLFFPVSTSSSIQPEIGYGAAASVITGIILGFVTLLYLYISKKLEDIY